MQATQKMASALNYLREICRDGERGYKAAAEAVKDSALQAELLQYSRQRRDFGAELEEKIDFLGETSEEGGTVTGALHRGWVNLEKAIGRNDRHTMLAECERGEDAAVEAYRKAIDGDLSPEILRIVQDQYEKIQRVHERVKQLRDDSEKA